jgi:hypothetical protein
MIHQKPSLVSRLRRISLRPRAGNFWWRAGVLANYQQGFRETHPLPANADKIEPEGTYSVFPVGSDQISGKHDRPVRTRGQN